MKLDRQDKPGSELPPATADWHKKLQEVRTKPSNKRCATCDVDVTLDGFRAALGDGRYACRDCDERTYDKLRNRLFLRRKLFGVAVFVAIISAIVGLVLVAVDQGTAPAAGIRTR